MSISSNPRRAAVVTLLLLCMLAEVGQARRRRRGRRHARSRSSSMRRASTPATWQGLGVPRVVVVHREGIAAYEAAAGALRRLGRYSVQVVTFAPDEAMADLRADLRDHNATVFVALGEMARRVCATGLRGKPVVFAYGPEAPHTAVPWGGWIRMTPPARVLLVWARRLRPRLRVLGVVLPAADSRLVGALERAGQRLGVRLRFASAASAGGALSAAIRLFRQRVDALWLGPDYRLWTAARLRALRRLQHLFSVPIMGQSAFQVRLGVAMAVDAPPAAVADAVDRMLKKHLPAWIRAQGRRRARGNRQGVSADVLKVAVPSRWRATLGERALRRLGAPVDKLLRAGAVRGAP